MEYRYDDNLHLYRAVIHDNCKAGDDRLQVRVLPWMADIEGEEEENLPKYPPFFRGQAIRGYTEKEPSEKTGAATSVWVLANSDFTVGYVLGPVPPFTGAVDGALQTSWNYQETKSVLATAGATPTDFSYEDCEVRTNDEQTFIEITSYKSPYHVFMTDKGTMEVIKEEEIFLMARAGTKPGDDASYIRITPTKIECKGKTFDLAKSEAVVLGHHGLNALGTYSGSAVPCEGINLSPCSKIIL